MYRIRYTDPEGEEQELTVDHLTIWREDAGFGSANWSPEEEEELTLIELPTQIILYDARGVTSVTTVNSEQDPVTIPDDS